MNYSKFNKTNDHAYNVRRALEYCKEHQIQSLEFPKDVYHFYADTASEGIYCTSNHGVNGYKRIAFLLKQLKNFTLDGGGSEFVFHNVMNPIVADECENLTLKNFAFYTPNAFSNTGEITAVGSNWFEVEILAEQPHYVAHGQLFFGAPKGLHYPVEILIEAQPDKIHLQPNRQDYYLNAQDNVEQINENVVRFTGLNRPLPVLGNKMLLMCRARDAACILLQNCKNTRVLNYTAYTGVGMGLLAQNCETVLVDNMKTCCKPERYLSLNADATHFVNCCGKVTVQNSSFSGQLDDALNVHGIYTRIIRKQQNSLVVKYMHPQAKGLNCYRVGDTVSVVDPESLLPKATGIVTAVEVLNIDCTHLTIEGNLNGVLAGDDLENVSRYPEVYFCHNRVEYNRARGILLGSCKKTVISNNYFNTAGAAILFESNGDFWFESGAVQDVVIENNEFENCKYGAWCSAVIEVAPRKKTEENRYFHGNISVQNNRFHNCKFPLFKANNVRSPAFENNKIEPERLEKATQLEHCSQAIITNLQAKN